MKIVPFSGFVIAVLIPWRVICFDEFGPLEIQPHAGASWHPHKQPVRLPATCTRMHGTRYLLAAYDIHGDHRWGQVLTFFKAMRKRYPKNVHLYVILDNRGSHKKAEIMNWAKQNRVTLVFTPTYAFWLNRIEAHFTALKNLRYVDVPSWTTKNKGRPSRPICDTKTNTN